MCGARVRERAITVGITSPPMIVMPLSSACSAPAYAADRPASR